MASRLTRNCGLRFRNPCKTQDLFWYLTYSTPSSPIVTFERTVETTGPKNVFSDLVQTDFHDAGTGCSALGIRCICRPRLNPRMRLFSHGCSLCCVLLNTSASVQAGPCFVLRYHDGGMGMNRSSTRRGSSDAWRMSPQDLTDFRCGRIKKNGATAGWSPKVDFAPRPQSEQYMIGSHGIPFLQMEGYKCREQRYVAERMLFQRGSTPDCRSDIKITEDWISLRQPYGWRDGIGIC